MKIRDGFVSNSSSASFIIGLCNITGKQFQQIVHYSLDGDELEGWTITVADDEIKGYTSMNNFDFGGYLDRIGVDPNVIEWIYT